jgi:hypothetical protein
LKPCTRVGLAYDSGLVLAVLQNLSATDESLDASIRQKHLHIVYRYLRLGVQRASNLHLRLPGACATIARRLHL